MLATVSGPLRMDIALVAEEATFRTVQGVSKLLYNFETYIHLFRGLVQVLNCHNVAKQLRSTWDSNGLM
jgi:hypothetical protein